MHIRVCIRSFPRPPRGSLLLCSRLGSAPLARLEDRVDELERSMAGGGELARLNQDFNQVLQGIQVDDFSLPELGS